MKSKLAIATLVGLTACNLALAQNEPAAAAPNPAPDAGTSTAAVGVSNPASDAGAPAAASGAQSPASVIPLIQFQDVPLITAIDNLARQAGINYILDPKVGYGQPDEKGQVRVQPNISIRWENLTAGQALNALITTYGLQLVEDPRNKIARVTVKDPAAAEPLQTRVVQLKYAAPSNIVASVQTTFTDKRSKVIADVRTSQLVVSATEKEHDAVEKLVARLDTPTKQVLIEAKLLETSKNPKMFRGVNWSGTLEAQTVAYGNNGKIPPATESYSYDGGPNSSGLPLSTLHPMITSLGGSFNPAQAFLNADGVSAVFSFINQDADAKIISTPSAVTLDNQEATLSVTRAHPIFKATAGTQGSPGGSEVTYTNLGTILRVTPRVSANDFVNLRVEPEVSSVIANGARKVIAGQVSEADIYDIRTIKTEVMIPSGNTLVLGGLVSDDTAKSYTKVPFLGDIPGLGQAFRSKSREQLRKNLIIFITPSIVKDDDFQPTTTTFLKNRKTDDVEEPLSFYDSAKPANDWSNKDFKE
jgi:type II secretory pathway component GspD/PulD (secretin)